MTYLSTVLYIGDQMEKEVIECREAYIPKFRRGVRDCVTAIFVGCFMSYLLLGYLLGYLLGDPYEPDSFAITIPHTHEVEPKNAGAKIRIRGYEHYSQKPSYTEIYSIPERCLMYRGSTLSTHISDKEGDWLVASYYHGHASHLDECPRNSRILMRDSVFKSWQGQFELALQDAADKALLLRRY